MSGLVSRVTQRLRQSAAFHLTRVTGTWPHPRVRPLPEGRLLVSFTFDDFPRSALHEGGRVLEGHGARGTYYVCLSRCVATGSSDSDHRFEAGDVSAVLSRGHELGCHTWSHLDCTAAPASRVREELQRNAEAAARLAPGGTLQHFAWPYGRLRPGHKAELGGTFRTLRTIFPGVHRGEVDLRLLRANRLYGGEAAVTSASRLIDKAARSVWRTGAGVWLLFFTHEVCPRPSPIGTTPAALEAVVRHAVRRGARVLPVGEVTARVDRGITSPVVAASLAPVRPTATSGR